MSVSQILDEDWSDYDNKKITDSRDANFFACTEQWERNYLKEKIKKHYPGIADDKILSAINMCCGSLRTPFPRRNLVECVLHRLGY